MRISLLLMCTLFACGAPKPVDLPEVTPVTPELAFSAQAATVVPLSIYARLEAGVATWDTELSYAFGDGYPEQVSIALTGSIYVIQGCALASGTATWSSLTAVQGTAAALSLEAGTLHVTLEEEGLISAVLEGQVDGLECMVNGESVTSLPLRHEIVLRVRRIGGFVVEQLHQRWPGCAQNVVLPSGATLWMPAVHPLDSAGQRFEAANAPVPAAMTLRSTGALSPGNESWGLIAEPGHVEVLVDTTKPVQGLKSFEVIGPDALTSVQASLVLRKAASKGSVTEPITEGGDYRLFFPELENLVDLDVASATANHGPLCTTLPAAWFSTTTSTSATCGPASGEQYGGGLPMASILAPGQCSLEITIPNTTHRWAASFSTR